MRILYIILVAAFIVEGCKQSKNISSESKSTSTMEDGWKKTPNSKNNYFLYVEVVEESAQNPVVKKRFYIADEEGNKVFEESIYGGYVKWVDDTKVEYFNTPGVIPADYNKNDFIMIYDIEKGKSYTKSAEKN